MIVNFFQGNNIWAIFDSNTYYPKTLLNTLLNFQVYRIVFKNTGLVIPITVLDSCWLQLMLICILGFRTFVIRKTLPSYVIYKESFHYNFLLHLFVSTYNYNQRVLWCTDIMYKFIEANRNPNYVEIDVMTSFHSLVQYHARHRNWMRHKIRFKNSKRCL